MLRRFSAARSRLSACVVLLAVAPFSAATTLSPQVQAKVRAATFEVVMKKPQQDSLTYERPLPLHLLSYTERTDEYISIGTAFAIAPNRFVTAAHVLLRGFNTHYGAPALRDASGQVHSIHEVFKYSDHKDIAVFSVVPPFNTEVLDVKRDPALDETVFAVGNALGEGIVTRDGLLTSQTPEQRDGRWKWLRFSAAASPGNSGGPLLDGDARVLGVVMRKSPSENLNYAAPISIVLDSPEVAHLEGETTYGLPIFDARETGRLNANIRLPKAYAALASEIRAAYVQHFASLRERLLQTNAESLFPRGAGSRAVLYGNFTTDMLAVVARGGDGNWGIFVNEQPSVSQLDANGYVATADMLGVTYFKIRRPDTIDARDFYTSSDAFMRILLKAIPWKRAVGMEEVRIVSMGAAKEESQYVDRYGRKWQLRVWSAEHQDTLAMSMAMPTPDGYLGILRWIDPLAREDATEDLKSLATFSHLALTGTLSQWREYLALREWLPQAFDQARIEYQYGKSFSYRSQRVEFTFAQALQRISADTRLRLAFAYFDDGGRVAWDVAGMIIAEDAAMRQTLVLNRYAKPPASLSEELTVQWQKLAAREFPYNARLVEADGASFISGVHPHSPPGKGSAAGGRVLYQLGLVRQGRQDEGEMQSTLQAAFGGFAVKEAVADP